MFVNTFMASYSRSQLQALLGSNVVEAKFVRRHPKLGWSNIRGAFVTTNYELLNDDLGFNVLHFKPPKGVGMGYDPRNYNLVVSWDIFRQEYRCFAVEYSNINNFYDVSTPEKRQDFWVFFRDYIMALSNDEKLLYMGYTG